jgi:probable rRNA maturation factor
MVILQKPVAGLNEGALERFVLRAKRAAGLRGAVSVLVTSSQELRQLNRRFRGLDIPTDVLSFPAQAVSAAKFAGDVAISAEIAAQNARRLGHSPAEEIKILTLHGVLHLAGYDHETDNGEMARREGRLRQLLGLSPALIERSKNSTGNGVRAEVPPRRRRQVAGAQRSSRTAQRRAR